MKLLPKFQPGGIIRRNGDPYEYTKNSKGQYSYRKKRSNDSWTIASGSAASSISKLFDKSPTSSNTPTTNSQGVPLMIAKPDENRHSLYNTSLISKPKVYDMNDVINSNNEYQINKIKARQQDLKNKGYNIVVDGVWGKKSQAAADAYAAKTKQSTVKPVTTTTPNPTTTVEPERTFASRTRDFLLRHTDSPMLAGGIMMASDAFGINAPLTEKAMNQSEKDVVKQLGANLKEGEVKQFGYGDGTGKSSMATPDEYKPFGDNQVLNDAMRKISGIYGRGYITKKNGKLVINGGEYDFNQSDSRKVATAGERWDYARENGASIGSALKGTAQAALRNIAPSINTVDYDERDMIEKLDDNGRPMKDASGKFIMMPNPDKEKNIELNKTRKRGALMEATIAIKKGGLIPRRK